MPLGAVAGCAALAALGPTDESAPLCPTKILFGIDCPFCGGLRCAAAIGRWDLVGAADHNILVVCVLPFAVVWWAIWMVRSARDPQAAAPKIPAALWQAFAVSAAVFTVARNVVGGSAGRFLAAAN